MWRVENVPGGETSLIAVTSTRNTWTQWNSLVVRDDMMGRHWETADGRSMKAKTVLPPSKVKDAL
jgi:hypothetical protein